MLTSLLLLLHSPIPVDRLGEDLQVANAELKLQRRSKLRVLLEQEQQQYKRELAAKGLAILYDEP